MNTPKLLIVVPCYNEEEVLSETTTRLTSLLEELVNKNKIDARSGILYVNDGSKDSTWSIIKKTNCDNKYVCGVNLACNVGHQHALMAGMNVAKDNSDIVISIDADLQDDINIIPQMIDKFSTEGCDVVYGVRHERKTDTWFKRTTALMFYKLMDNLGVKSIYNHADYRLLSQRAVKQLCEYHERNLFIRGMVPLIGYKSDKVFYDRAERFAGESKYPLRKMLNFAIDGITSFSVKPVRMVFTIGTIFLLIAFCILIYVIASLVGGNTIQGWASLMLSLWFIGGSILVGIGIVGEYIGKIYIEVKNRPLYNIEEVLFHHENSQN